MRKRKMLKWRELNAPDRELWRAELRVGDYVTISKRANEKGTPWKNSVDVEITFKQPSIHRNEFTTMAGVPSINDAIPLLQIRFNNRTYPFENT